jgi:hypothetical protein
MKSILSTFTLVAGILLIAGCATTSPRDTSLWASLAIDRNQGRAYGVSYDYPSAQEADARAIKECGVGCHVVKNFTAGCGAYAADQARNGKASGWGTASTEAEAKSIALNYCRQYGGTNCIIRVWSCNSH